MGQASITVDIQAKIVGYQQEIERIKAALKDIRVDSSVGKDLSKSLKLVEREVDNLAKHMSQRLSSDSQITGFTDRLNEVEEAFVHIGQVMSGTSFGDLDLAKVDSSFKELITDIEAARTALAEKTESGFKTAVEDSQAISKAFERLGIDISTLSSSEVGQVLSTSFDSLNKSIEQSKTRLQEVGQEIKTLKQQRDDLSNKPILQVGDSTKEAQRILGSKEELGFGRQFDQNAFQQFSEKIQSAINSAKPEIQKSSGEINNLLKSIGDSSTQQEVAANLDKLLSKIRELRLQGAAGFNSQTTGSSLAEKMFSDVFDESKLDAALERIRQKLTESGISEADVQQMIPKIKTDLLANNLQDAQKVIKENLDSTKRSTEKLITDINKDLERLGQEQATLRSQKGKDIYTRGLVETAKNDYGEIIRQLQEENASLRQRIEALEKSRDEKREEALSRIQSGGKATEGKGKIGLNENIQAAKQYRTELEQVQAKEKLIGKIEGVVQRWFSIYAAVRMVGNAIRSVISTVKELDKTITEIAIVTDMTQNDLWGQMKSYTDMARQYAASISGVYQVSQLYYQQGGLNI